MALLFILGEKPKGNTMADSIFEGAVNDLTDMSEFTEPTDDAETTGADEAEVSSVETEMQESTEPADTVDEQIEEEQAEEDIPQGKRSRDSAFAEMRRAREEAERQNSELQERLEALERAQREADLRSYAEGLGLSEEEIEQVVADAAEEEEREAERANLEAEIERLSEENLNYQVDRMMEKDLRDIQEIDPSVKSLDELGEDFGNFVAAGLSGVDAYYAMMSKRERTQIKPAPSLGKANQASVPRDYYTSEELDALSQEEILANWDKVQRSMDRL